MLPTPNRYARSVIPGRPDYSWPDGKRLAFWVATNIETFAYGEGVSPDPVIPTGAPPTHRNYAWRDYGNRVGIWSLFDLYEELGLPTACLVNSYVYNEYPEIIARLRARGDAVVAHGRTNSEWQRGMEEDDERALIAEATATLTDPQGRAPQGWLGPGVAETPLTPDLLKEAGYSYLLDWPCDDQPVWLETRAVWWRWTIWPISLSSNG
jgi:allantoinase